MSDPAPQSLGSHLQDLRKILIRCALVLLATSIAAFNFAPRIFAWLTAPYRVLLDSQDSTLSTIFLQTLQPAETFKMSISLALLGSAVVLLPYLFFELWRFLRPGLYARERRWLGLTLSCGTLLFVGGLYFAYTVVVPLVLRFFWEYSVWLGITPAWSVSYYTDFILSTLFAFGVAFELPIATTSLAIFGVISANQLAAGRRYAIFSICCGAAIITPPDVISLIFMAVPLIVLYEASVLLARGVARRKQSTHGDET